MHKWLLLPVLLLNACTTMQDDRPPVNWQRFTTGEVKVLRAFSLSRFEVVGDKEVVVWDGVSKAYLMRTMQSCFIDKSLSSLAFSGGMSSIQVRVDAILYGNQRCQIERIQSLNVANMRQEHLAN
ncbi:DUF6491 family protein [Gallaecimonas mangrovi]|uniref:DUF6491 family protein n=1 Tax=Gallaecimonas mangrovi TaxID=2291597 RepID=UPI000E20AF99|nr:DUF6491 family protein [Gallaecimonas mangrovi]